MCATLGPALVGELLRQTMARNASLLGANLTDFNPEALSVGIENLYGMVQKQALIVSMKEIYGWLLMAAIITLALILVNANRVRPFAIFPKWSKIRRAIKHIVRTDSKRCDFYSVGVKFRGFYLNLHLIASIIWK